MSQVLHLVFELDENKNRRVVHVGLDKSSVRSASRQDQGAHQVRLYAAISVDNLRELMTNTEGLVVDSATLLP